MARWAERARPYPSPIDELAAYERRLRRAGLPLLIEDYSAYEDIFTRGVPLLSLVVISELLGAVDRDWPVMGQPCWRSSTSSSGSGCCRSCAARRPRLVGQLAASLKLLTRAVPVLLIFMIVLFINTEMWQVFSAVSDGALLGVIALFIGVASAFVISRLPREVRALEREVGADPPPTTR